MQPSSGPWLPFVTCAVWLLLHLALYVLVLRHRREFRRELVVFRYHALSALGLLLVLLLAWVIARIDLAALVGGAALHGLYSVSFLEVWSLAEGGYSLRILMRIRSLAAPVSPEELRDLESLGSEKKQARLQSLARLGLIDLQGESIELTTRGRWLGRGFEALAWLSRIEEAG